MWRAYYNHQFFKMFMLLLRVMRTQLRLNWYQTFRLAYNSGRAAVNFRLKRGREDYNKVLKHLTRYYKIVSDHSLEPFDYKKTAKLELEWWDIHRYPKKYKKSLEQSLAENMAVVYKTDAAKLKDYAHWRAKAMMLPNHTSDEEEPTEWKKVKILLLKSWHSLHSAIQK